MEKDNQVTHLSPLERLSELKQKFEKFVSKENLEEVRNHFTETMEHAQASLSNKVDQEVKQSLKQTSAFIETQKRELETYQKKINVLLKKFSPKKKAAKKVSSKKKATKKVAAKTKKTSKKR